MIKIDLTKLLRFFKRKKKLPPCLVDILAVELHRQFINYVCQKDPKMFCSAENKPWDKLDDIFKYCWKDRASAILKIVEEHLND